MLCSNDKKMPNITWQEIDDLKHEMKQELHILSTLIFKLQGFKNRMLKFDEKLDNLVINHESETK